MLKRTVGFGVGRLMGWLWVVLALLFSGNSLAADTVCAQVKIEIKQELTLERQAFDAMMRINNGLDTLPINNVKVSVNFEDEDGLPVLASSDPNNTDAKFFIRVDTMDNIADVDGYGSVAPASSAEIHWLIIPSTGAAGDSPTGKLFFVGAQLDYTLGGEPERVVVTPDFITVKPLPKLTLDYFLTKEVNADDPLTAEIEPIEPYTLGVRVQNNGLAAAKDLKIDSAQPKIIENEQGLLIGFEITGSSVNDEPIAPVLLIDFGDIAGNSSKVGRWEMISTLAGEFVEFTATFTHSDELGGALTSILEATNAHLLVRDVRVDLPGRDGVRDFLAQDGDALRVYESDSVDTEVTDQSSQASLTLDSQSGTQVDHTLSFPATAGFAYVKLLDPYNGEKIITRVVRSDGKVISLDNAWTSKTRNKETHPYSWTHYINFFDTNTTGAYAVRMDAEVLGPVPPVLQYIPPRTTYEGNQVGFLVEASDPNGETPALSAAPLPNGAAFADNGDGTAFFNWTPTVGQAGTYTITYTATDGALSASRSATIKVNPEWDTDGDGMADAWEIEHFGNLDRDGSGDFDGDGISDLDEYLDGTDPSDGPQPPTIEAPLYDTEVTSLQPVLSVLNSAHAPGGTMTYSYEVYADAAMTQLVASADSVAEGQETTGWTVPVSLDDNTGYTWRVRAFDGTVYSLWSNGRFFVNTVNDAPGAFAISSPADGAEIDTLTPQLSVINAIDADRDLVTYRFEVSEFIDMASPVASVESVAEGSDGTTSWLVDIPLMENSYYYWRATAVDEHGLETPGPIGGIFINTTNEAPSAPIVNSPLAGDIVTSDTVSLIVGNATDPDGDPLSYSFELDTVSSFDSPDKQVSPAISEGNATTQWTVSALTEDTTYYWRIKANDGLVDSDWTSASFIVNATNTAPTAPTVSNPGNQSWVAGLEPTLQINAATDPDGDTLQYRFELFDDTDLTTPQASQLTTETQWAMSAPLVNHRWYFWHARSEDPSGAVSDWSTLSSFFVDDNGINDTPTLSFIEPAADIEVSGSEVALRWDDNDPDSNATITLYYDNDNAGEDGIEIAGPLAEDDDGEADLFNWSIATLPNGNYWVYAVIDDGNTRSVVYNSAMITVTGRLDVPDIVGLDQSTAEGALTDAGLSVGTVTEVIDTTGPIGQVIEQDPAAGTTLLPGSVVNMVVIADANKITDLSASAKTDRIDISWTSVPGAESYNIYRSLAESGPYELIASEYVSDYAGYLDTGLTLNVTYYYVVTSLVNGFESSYSNVASATTHEIDIDNDGMPDSFEISYGLNPADASDAAMDLDGDGLTNLEEYGFGTNPLNLDSDADGIPDGFEVGYGLNPTDASDAAMDLDGDGLTNLEEYGYGTDPLNYDSDGDGIPDGANSSEGPQEPTLNSPLYDAEVASLQPALVINNSPHSASASITYSYEVYADAEMTQLVASGDDVVETTDATAWTVPVSLSENTGYTWRVRSFDGTVYSLWTNGRFFVNVANDPPDTFTISSPLDGAEVDLLNPILSITNTLDPDRDSVTYRFEVSEFADLSTLVTSADGIVEGTGGATSWQVDVPLMENGYYYWRATAVDEHALGTPGPIGGVFINTLNDAPSAPAIVSPTVDELIETNSPNLSVSNSLDSESDQLVYYFELDTVSSFDGVDKITSGPISEGIDRTEWNVTGLSEDSTYYWRVRASDGVADSDWSQGSFVVNTVNAMPGMPTLSNPGNQAWVATLQPNLQINAPIDLDSDILQYRYEVSTTSGPIAEKVTQATSWQIESPLNNHQWYFWRVRAEDPAGAASDWTTLSSFFTDDNGVNDTPTISFVEPVDNVILASGSDLTLRWEDQDPDSEATISLYYDQDNTGGDGVLLASNIMEEPDGLDDTYTLSSSTLGVGTHWIYAIIDDGNTSTTTYLPYSIKVESIEIIMDNTPANANWTPNWSEMTSKTGYYGSSYLQIAGHSASPDSLIIDNASTAFSYTGNWVSASDGMGFIGADYVDHLSDPTNPEPDTVDDEASWMFQVAETASYQLYTRRKREVIANPSTGAPYTIQHAMGTDTVLVAQHTYGSGWVDLGSYQFDQNVDYIVTVSGDTGGTRADAIMLEPPNAARNSVTWTFTVPQTGLYNVEANWTISSYNSTNAPYTITHSNGSDTVFADQTVNGGSWNLLGSYTFEQGITYTITLTDDASGAIVADAIRISSP